MPLNLPCPQGWRAREAAHLERSGRYALPFAARRERGEKHPVEDFLFTYYTLKPGQFMRWHPGAGVILLDAAERAVHTAFDLDAESEATVYGGTGR